MKKIFVLTAILLALIVFIAFFNTNEEFAQNGSQTFSYDVNIDNEITRRICTKWKSNLRHSTFSKGNKWRGKRRRLWGTSCSWSCNLKPCKTPRFSKYNSRCNIRTRCIYSSFRWADKSSNRWKFNSI